MKIIDNQFSPQVKNYEIQPQKSPNSRKSKVSEQDYEHPRLPGEKVINDEMINKSIGKANEALMPTNKVVERKVHEKTGAIMYTIKNSDTGEVIREFPPEKIEDMLAKMWELAGLFVDEKI